MPVLDADVKGMTAAAGQSSSAGCRMDQQSVERYLEWMKDKGRSNLTLAKYRRSLTLLYDFLPEDKYIRRGTLAQWRTALLDAEYTESSVNAFIVAANTFLGYMDHRECQLTGALKTRTAKRPELSRAEYLRLLSSAKALGNETAYMLVKTFACTGIYVNGLLYITVENVLASRFTTTYQNKKRTVRVPKCLQAELLDYAARQGIRSGLIFRTSGGTPMPRGWAVRVINRLGQDARVPEERSNPTALRKLFVTTRDTVMSNLELFADQAMDRQLEQEQLTIGWDAPIRGSAVENNEIQ